MHSLIKELPMEQRTLQSLIVTKANELAQAGSNLTLVEAKVLEYCISTIFKGQVVTAEDIFEVDVNHLSNLFDMDKSQAKRELAQLLNNLLTKVVKIDLVGQKIAFQWLSAVRSNDLGSGLHIQFNPVICNYLNPTRLNQGKFTAYPLEHIAHFKYNFSLSLYNLIKSNNYKGAGFSSKLSLEELREFLFLKENEYKLWGDLKRQITKCLKEIETKTSLKVKLVERKKGRLVKQVVFVVEQTIGE
jgi:plasmid replication initiation protein